MKVNLNIPIKDYQGRGITKPDPRDDSKKIPCLAKDIICDTLVSIANAPKDDKILLSALAKKIWESKGTIDLTPEEMVLIRDYVSVLPAGLMSAIYSILK
jgi:hypothetical protein